MSSTALFNEDCLVLMDELNRNFIGVELDKKYFEIAKERINAKQ